MRVTSQFLYNNFNQDQQKVNKELKKVSEQISSGQLIQNSYDDPGIFDDTLRLDTQINELKGIQQRTAKAQNFATATDDTLQDFTNSLRTFKTRLIAAANDSINPENREAIAVELEEEKAHMLRLANTQIGGEYLFSGSTVSIKPFDSEGKYYGNNAKIETIIGEGVTTAYNIDGNSLFLGSTDYVHKEISTNVQLKNVETNDPITVDDTLKDLVNGDGVVSFKLSGTKHDGTVVKEKFNINTNETMDTLLRKIGEIYGNNSTSNVVDVSLNEHGNIVVKDISSGKSQLEMKLRGEFEDKSVDFIKSDYELAVPDNDDSAYFKKEGSTLTGNVSLMANGELANDTIKLEGIANGSLYNKSFIMNGENINGESFRVVLSLDHTSSFEVEDENGNKTTYYIYDAQGNVSDVSDITVGLLNNVVSMVVSDKLPESNSATDFNTAVIEADKLVDVSVNQNGNMQIHDKSSDLSKIKFAMYDFDANNFAENPPSPTLAFNSNNAVTTQKAQMDFFAQLDEIIDAVRTGKSDVSSESGDPRNIGIQNAIAQIDQFDSHFNTQLAKVGTIEKSLQTSEERAMTMEVNLQTLKSDLTDVDEAEAYLRLNDLSLTYQAILSSVTKINSLTLLNYMK